MLHSYFYIVSLPQIMWFVRIRRIMNRNIIKSAFSLNNNPVYTCSEQSVHWSFMDGLYETFVAAWGQCTWWHLSCRRRHGGPKVWRRTCVVFLTTHGHDMNYAVRGSKLTHLMMSARHCVASSTVLRLRSSTYSVSDIWRHFTLPSIKVQHLQDSSQNICI